METLSRKEYFARTFPDLPAYRFRQCEAALFSADHSGFRDIAVLPADLRDRLERELPWMSVTEHRVMTSRSQDTHKALVELRDGERIETVLMRNRRGQWTICVSSQVGCAMACAFCATGTMGFRRNLSGDEIADQYRFWQTYLRRIGAGGRISNVVYMGMGEPLANSANVKESLRQLLAHTDLGPTRLTVSTVGLIPALEALIDDPEWPPVRLAVSLHSADAATRKRIMPTSYDAFLDDLAAWAARYFSAAPERRRHLTFEYVMLAGVNDTPDHARALVRFAHRVGKVRVNLIPYNFTGSVYRESLPGDFARFEATLGAAGVTVLRRRTMGDDIAAACGQLAVRSPDAIT